MFGQYKNSPYLCHIARTPYHMVEGVYIDERDVYETLVLTVTNFPTLIRYQANGSVASAHGASSCHHGQLCPTVWFYYYRLCTGAGRPFAVYPVTERQGKACGQRDRQTAQACAICFFGGADQTIIQ